MPETLLFLLGFTLFTLAPTFDTAPPYFYFSILAEFFYETALPKNETSDLGDLPRFDDLDFYTDLFLFFLADLSVFSETSGVSG